MIPSNEYSESLVPSGQNEDVSGSSGEILYFDELTGTVNVELSSEAFGEDGVVAGRMDSRKGWIVGSFSA